MKKLLTSLIVSLGLVVGLVGCVEKTEAPTNNQEQAVESEVTITVLDINGDSLEYHANFKEGQTLMEVLKDSGLNIDETDGFINRIGDIKANSDNKEFLALYVNGEMSMVGATDLILEDGDIVEFKIENWE